MAGSIGKDCGLGNSVTLMDPLHHITVKKKQHMELRKLRIHFLTFILVSMLIVCVSLYAKYMRKKSFQSILTSKSGLFSHWKMFLIL